jgi:hypothetical protein
VFQAFKKKLAKPQHAEAMKDLNFYLENQKKNMSFVEDIVKQTVEKALKVK